MMDRSKGGFLFAQLDSAQLCTQVLSSDSDSVTCLRVTLYSAMYLIYLGR